MDDIVARTRYPRHNIHRQRRRSIKAKSTLGEKILKQIAASILILAVIGIIKSINTPFTGFITTKIQGALFNHIEFNSLYKGVENLYAKITGAGKVEKAETDFEEDAVAVSAGAGNIDLDFILPLDGVLTSEFGERNHPLQNSLVMHKGVDIEAPEGIAIKVVLDGEVIDTGDGETYGKYIKIKHDYGFVTVYAHCSKVLVKKGQILKQGEFIGEVGSTGLSVGSHLHFEIWVDGVPVNPLNYLEIPLS